MRRIVIDEGHECEGETIVSIINVAYVIVYDKGVNFEIKDQKREQQGIYIG